MSLEILAPAGNPDALTAAVRCGADAVYLGMGELNARKNAGNFDDAQFRSAAEYCRIYGVKVYLTLNTLVRDAELSAAARCLEKACAAGIDGVIVQDLAAARMVREMCPELRLHASTQMTIHSTDALGILKEAGFRRVVLAREMSRGEIAEFSRRASELGIETEIFVHGALCMSVSGQCYMSSVFGRRSGNRGLCAQPCRLPFADESHPLSLKDMSLISEVGELSALGVTSLKIEGRMKRPEYVAASVSAFRAAADGKEPDAQLLGLLGGIFGRGGHTDGYFKGKIGADMFGFRTREDVAASASAEKSLHELYRRERQSVPVSAVLTLSSGSPSVLTLSDGEHTAAAEGEPAAASERPLGEDYAREQCGRLGGTPFYLNSFTLLNSEGLSIPPSGLKSLRREAAAALTETRVSVPKSFKGFVPKPPVRVPAPSARIIARFASADRVPDVHGADMIFVPLETGADRLAELVGKARVPVGVELPRALFSLSERCSELLSAARSAGVSAALCGSIGAVALAKSAGMDIYGDFGLNLFNSAAVRAAEDIGVAHPTVSFELELNEAKMLQDGKTGLFAYGRIPLMLCRACPVKAKTGCAQCGGRQSLTDRTGAVLPVRCRFGAAEILNSVPLRLEDRLAEISGFEFLLLRFDDETPQQCADIISAYRRGGAVTGEYTRGLYYRGAL